MTRAAGRRADGEPILERGFRILSSFVSDGEALSLTELSERAGLPKSTTSRLAQQLLAVGALERLEDATFVVGLRLWEMGSLAPRGHGLRSAARPVMEDLHHVTGQHILLAVRDGQDGVLVERISAPTARPVKYRVGGRIPLQETGVGVALLAHAPADVRDACMSRARDPRRLRRLLAMVVREGLCAVAGPNPLAGSPALLSTVAAPIVDQSGGVVGAVSLVAEGSGGTQVANRVAIRTASLAIARALGPVVRSRQHGG